MKILSSFNHHPLVLNLYEFLSYAELKRRYKKKIVTKQLTVAIDLHSIIFFILCKSMATVKCLVASILQNIFFCIQQFK